MDCIVLTANIEVIGEDLTKKWFNTQQQFYYYGKEIRRTYIWSGDTSYNGQYLDHYSILIDEEYFWIPQVHCVVYNEPVLDEYRDKIEREFSKYSNNDEKDVYKAYDALFNFKVDNVYRPQKDWRMMSILIGLPINFEYDQRRISSQNKEDRMG